MWYGDGRDLCFFITSCWWWCWWWGGFCWCICCCCESAGCRLVDGGLLWWISFWICAAAGGDSSGWTSTCSATSTGAAAFKRRFCFISCTNSSIAITSSSWVCLLGIFLLVIMMLRSSVLRSNHFYAFYCVFSYFLVFTSPLCTPEFTFGKFLLLLLLLSFLSALLFILYILSCYDFSFTAHSRTPPRNATPTSFGWKNVDVLDKIEFSVSHTLAILLLEFLFILFIYFLLCYPSRGSSHFSNMIRFLNFNPDCAKNYSLLFVFCFYIIWRGWLDSPQ